MIRFWRIFWRLLRRLPLLDSDVGSITLEISRIKILFDCPNGFIGSWVSLTSDH